MKLSKTHVVKVAQEEKPLEEAIIEGAALEEELEDMEDGEEDKSKPAKYDARQEAATPHANAAKDLFAKRRDLMNQVSALDDQLAKHREVLRALDPKMRHEAYADDKELKTYLKPEKMEEKKKRKKKLDKAAETEVVEGLLKVAEVLDYAGDKEGVSIVENMLQIFAKKDEVPQYDVATIEKKERKYPEYDAPAPSLSIRNCPDHRTQMTRVADNSYQCPLDGAIYNWNTGFKDQSGNVYPEARIRSVDEPQIGERLFENRQMATSKNAK